MRPFRSLAHGLRALTRRGAADQDIADEVQNYLDHATAAHIARGLSPDAARRAAQLEIGNASVVAEQVRSFGWENLVETLFTDLRYAARWLRHNPGFTTVSAITLALGIGATTAIFSAVNPILFEPLAYPHPNRIVAIRYMNPHASGAEQAFGTFRELLTRSRAFDALAVMKAWQPTMTGPAEPERFDGQRVSAAYFRVLGVRPAMGRDFDDADDRPNGPKVVVISDALWHRRINADTAIVGRQIRLDDNLYTVVGVMPPGFQSVMAPSADVWSLLQYDPALPTDGREWGRHLRMFGRLHANVSIEQATRDLDAIGRQRVPEFRRPVYASMERGLPIVALQSEITSAVKPALLGVLGAVVLVLLIACVNVTNLLLARGAQRRGEFAMRAALGAGRGRLTRQLLTESLLLALIGGLLGVGVATIGVRALIAFSPPDLPRADAIGVHGVVFVFALAATTLIGLAVGVVPALSASRHDLQATLQRTSRRAPRQVTRRGLVVVEVSLALVLLVGAGLLLRSLERLFSVAPGFKTSGLLVMQVQASGARLNDQGNRFFADALDAVKRVPGVELAAFTSELPLSGEGQLEIYAVAWEHDANPNAVSPAFRYAVTPHYFETMGIPLRRGRLFDDGDLNAASARPVLINESFAKHKFGGLEPIGQRVRFGGPPNRPWDVIVGVVGDVKQLSLSTTSADAVYATTAQWLWTDNAQWLVVRTQGDPAALSSAVRRAIWSVDKDQPVVHVTTMDALVAASEAQRHFVFIVFEAFALVALALAATGIYGVLSGSVSERTREIGVRSALGASRSSILGLVVRQGMTLTLLGAVIGLVGASVASRALVTLLFGISRLDATTYAGVTAILLLVSAAACLLPAWRAARVDPAITLRAE